MAQRVEQIVVDTSTRPQRIWGEFQEEGTIKTFFLRVNESKIPLEFAQERIYDRENIPHEDRIIWLDDEMNAIEAKKNAALQKRKDQEKQRADQKAGDPKSRSKVRELFRDVEPQVTRIPTHTWANIKEFDLDYVLPKVSHLPQSKFLRWLKKVGDEYVNDPDQDLNDLVTRFIFTTKLVPLLFIAGDQKKKKTTDLTIRLVSKELNIPDEFLTQENFQQLVEFVRRTPFFILGTSSKRLDEGHAIFMKKANATTMTIIDPLGQNWTRNRGHMLKEVEGVVDRLFSVAGFTSFPESPCRFQAGRGTCLLWALFFALYPERTPEQLIKMIDDVVRIIGLPMNETSRDAVIMEVFFQFIQAPVKAQNVDLAEHRKGLGKCRKCGLPKRIKKE